MNVKPVSLGKDLSVPTEADDLDNARLVSIINTNTAAIKVIIAGSSDPYEIHMAGGERLSVEKEIGANITPELAAGGAVSASTVFGSQIAFTN
jgi:hypothetical protein